MLWTSLGERLFITPVSLRPIIQSLTLNIPQIGSFSGHLSVIDCFNWPSASGGNAQVVQLLCELKSPVNLKDAVGVPPPPPPFPALVSSIFMDLVPNVMLLCGGQGSCYSL